MSRGDGRLRILQVTATDAGGGADRVARRLADGLRARGHTAWLAAGVVTGADAHTLQIPVDGPNTVPGYAPAYLGLRRLATRWPGLGAGRLATALRLATHPAAARAWWTGLEDFDFPGSARLASLPPERPDLVHAHNLHGGYFDLRALPALSRALPVCLTPHDAWLTTGHCAHSFACDRWREGCGACPDLTIEPAVRRDRTADNWVQKARLLQASRVHVATPSRWLLERLQASLVAPAIASARVIPNGIDLDRFSPGPAGPARARFDLPPDAAVVLVTTGAAGAPWRDAALVLETLERLLARLEPERPVRVLAAGAAPLAPGPIPAAIRARILRTGVLAPADMPVAFRAADVYFHAARADIFPTAILEALACGTPVVASRVGGIPEQVEALPLAALAAAAAARRGTGVLFEPGDAAAAAEALTALLSDPSGRAALSRRAVEDARARFSLDGQITACEDWYCAILSGWCPSAIDPPPASGR